MCGYNVTRSRPGLIGVTARSFRANRFNCSKAAKTPPSHIMLNNPYNWLSIDKAGEDIGEITGGGISKMKSSLTRIGLQEALRALADTIAHNDKLPGNMSVHCGVDLILHNVQANALCHCSLELCVSGSQFFDQRLPMMALLSQIASIGFAQSM